MTLESQTKVEPLMSQLKEKCPYDLKTSAVTWYETLECGSRTRPSLHRLPWCPLTVHRIWLASASFLCLMWSAPACSPNMWYQKDMHRSASGVVMDGLTSVATCSSSSSSSPVLLGASSPLSCMKMKFPGPPAGGGRRQGKTRCKGSWRLKHTSLHICWQSTVDQISKIRP